MGCFDRKLIYIVPINQILKKKLMVVSESREFPVNVYFFDYF